MNILITKEGQQYGPYTVEEVKQYMADGRLTASSLAWTDGLSNWLPLSSVLTATVCPQCQGEMVLQVESPQRSTGILVIVLGILLAPFCVGIFLFFWGLSLISETKSHWHCSGCGRIFPGKVRA